MDLLPEIAHRKSPRAFSPRPVEEDRIYPLLEAFRWAPSSYNRQPWRIVLVTDPAVREAMLTFKDRGVAPTGIGRQASLFEIAFEGLTLAA